MKAVVVYESLWGNTAAIARAIAAGLGPEAKALSTAEATPDILAGAVLGAIVALVGLQMYEPFFLSLFRFIGFPLW